MKMTELEFDGEQPPIDGYAPAGFRVGGAFIDGAVLLTRQGAQSWRAGPSAAALDAEAAAPLAALAAEIDILLIGLGPEIAPAPAAFRAALEASGLRYDAMATPAACRTYNVLLTEERRVAAALLTTGG